MNSNFTAAAQMAITMAIGVFIVTGCSKSTSDEEPVLVVVDRVELANDGSADGGVGDNNTSNSTSGSTDEDGSSNQPQPVIDNTPQISETLEPVTASYELVADKTIRISWARTQGSQFYRVLENSDGVSGFIQVSDDLDSSTQVFDHRVALHEKVNARYIVQACSANSCVDSEELILSGSFVDAIGYFKASNADGGDYFGESIALNSDGTVLVVGAPLEDGADSGVNADLNDNSLEDSGAVYVFVRNDGRWLQQAYIKAGNPGEDDSFGGEVSLSADGNTLAISASGDDSAATGINGNQNNNSSENSGAVYVFTNSGGAWQQQAYLKASNNGEDDGFGSQISLSGDGKTLVVSATGEDSNSTVINGNESNDSALSAGAVYVFTYVNGDWEQNAYLKASNAEEEDRFGTALGLNADGSTLVVSAYNESSAVTGLNGDQSNNSADKAGAVYLFERTSGSWQQQLYMKASNTDELDFFGRKLSLSADGETLAVTAWGEDSAATGINGDQNSDLVGSGAVYVFKKTSGNWQQQAYVKSSNGDPSDVFGTSISLSADGNTMLVGAFQEDSAALGIGGNQFDNAAVSSGAAFVFERNNGNWQQLAYLKASNTKEDSWFGWSTSLSSDGNTLAIGASLEDNSAIGINSNQNQGTSFNSGAVYLY